MAKGYQKGIGIGGAGSSVGLYLGEAPNEFGDGSSDTKAQAIQLVTAYGLTHADWLATYDESNGKAFVKIMYMDKDGTGAEVGALIRQSNEWVQIGTGSEFDLSHESIQELKDVQDYAGKIGYSMVVQSATETNWGGDTSFLLPQGSMTTFTTAQLLECISSPSVATIFSESNFSGLVTTAAGDTVQVDLKAIEDELDKKLSLTANGATYTADDKKITDVVTGVDAKDAVNKEQLDNALANLDISNDSIQELKDVESYAGKIGYSLIVQSASDTKWAGDTSFLLPQANMSTFTTADLLECITSPSVATLFSESDFSAIVTTSAGDTVQVDLKAIETELGKKLALTTDGSKYDADNKQLANLLDATNSQDAVTKAQLDELSDRVPEHIYTSFNSFSLAVTARGGSITLLPLGDQGKSDDEIRGINMSTIFNEMLDLEGFYWSFGSDYSNVFPMDFAKGFFQRLNSGRCSASLSSKSGSHCYDFSQEASSELGRWKKRVQRNTSGNIEVGTQTIGYDDATAPTNSKMSGVKFEQAKLGIEAHTEATVTINASDPIVIDETTIDSGGKVLSNISDAQDVDDATSLGQMVTAIDDSFDHAVNPTDGQDMQFLDSEKDDGYGFQQTKLTYFGVKVGDNDNLHTEYSKIWFIHLRPKVTMGFFNIHEDILDEFITEDISNINELGIVYEDFFTCIGRNQTGNKPNGTAPTGAIWDFEGLAIPETANANDTTNTDNFIKEDGTATTNKSEAANGCYSAGKTRNNGTTLYRRGYVNFVDENQDATISLDNSSPWFVGGGTCGGGTFGEQKQFMVMETSARNSFSVGKIFLSNAEILGGAVESNSEECDDLSYRVSQLEQGHIADGEDANGLEESISVTPPEGSFTMVDNTTKEFVLELSDKLRAFDVNFTISNVSGSEQEYKRVHVYNDGTSFKVVEGFAYGHEFTQLAISYNTSASGNTTTLSIVGTGSGETLNFTYKTFFEFTN